MEKSIPLPLVPMITLPVDSVALPTNVGVVIDGLVLKTKLVLVVPVAPEAV
jgi:hypothetical protein